MNLEHQQRRSRNKLNRTKPSRFYGGILFCGNVRFQYKADIRSRKKHVIVKQLVHSQLHAADCAQGGAGDISHEPLFFPLPTHQA